MNIYIIVLIGIFLFFNRGTAQTESGYIPYSSSLLLNPAYAGYQKKSSLWSTFFIAPKSNEIINHDFHITYDKWAEKLKGGVAWYFYHGLEGRLNTNHTGIGFTYAPQYEIKKGNITTAINLNYSFYTKQWLVFVVDEVVDKENSPYEPPGLHFMRYNMLIPKIGILWSSEGLNSGISIAYRYRHHLRQMQNLNDPEPIQFILHVSPILNGNKKGLLSRPYRAIPELIMMISQETFFTRLGFRMEKINKNLEFFVQNDFRNDIAGVAGLYSLKFENLNISFTAGSTFSFDENELYPFGEISLGLIIPYKMINENYPWAPTPRIIN